MRQSLANLFQTTTFRLGLVQATVVVAVAVVLMSYVAIATSGQLLQDADDAVDAEFQALSDAYGEGGMRALSTAVGDRVSGAGGLYYFLADPDGMVIVSQTQQPPGAPRLDPQRVEFRFTRTRADGSAESVRVRGLYARLLGGPTLLVASDLREARRIGARLSRVLISVAVLGIALALGSGLFAAWVAARRAEELSRTARDVMEGDLSQRATVRGWGDEFDQLASALNAMLDRIQRLVHTTRTAGDAIAHDLRTPLSRLRNRVEAALASPPDSEVDREALRKVKEESDRILEVFASVLRLARIEQTTNWPMAQVDLAEIARTMGEFYEPVAEEAGITLTVTAEGAIPSRGDAGLLEQALSNLLENAVKYTPAPGRIVVEARATRTGAVISVSDDGPGVPADKRASVLERFFRLDETSPNTGFGLGLSLVAAIVRLHRGHVVLGDGLGAPGSARPGLKVTLTLPSGPATAVVSS
jgi:hypothetical protein